MKGMAAALRPMITVTNTAHASRIGAAAPLRRLTRHGNSDLQDFGARSGFELACVNRHRQHAVVPNGTGQLDKSLIAEPVSK